MHLSMHTAQASDNAPFSKHAVSPIGLGVHLSVTATGPATELSSVVQAAPAEVIVTSPTVLLCLLRRLTDGSRSPTPEGSGPAFAWSNLPQAQLLSGPLQVGIRFLPRPLPAAPSIRLAARLPSREGYGLTTLHRGNMRGLGPA